MKIRILSFCLTKFELTFCWQLLRDVSSEWKYESCALNKSQQILMRKTCGLWWFVCAQEHEPCYWNDGYAGDTGGDTRVEKIQLWVGSIGTK